MNRKKNVVKTTEYIFCGITVIQVLLGLVWAFNQFPHMQNWQEPYEYLDISRTWIMDEYVSFLYPVLLKVCTGIEGLIGIPFYMPVYVIQLATVIFSSWFFTRKVMKLARSKAVWVVGYLTSFPMLLQFHMSVRTESLEVSGILMLMAFLETNIIGAAVMTLLLVWLNPDMVIIVVAAWIVYLIRELIKTIKMRKEERTTETASDWKRLGVKCGAFALALVIGLSVNALVQEPGSRGRIQKTFWAAAFQRVVTEYFSRSYAMWDDEVIRTYTIEEAMELANRSDNMMYKVGPTLEAEWGKEEANEMYKHMATNCFRVRTRDVVYQIRDDLIDSAMMPFSTWWQYNGERMSQTGWNYGLMREHSPRVALYYMNFSVYALALLLVSGLLRLIMNRKLDKQCIYMLTIALMQCLQSVLSTGNRVNYSLLLFVVLFWCYLAVPKQLEEKKVIIETN